MKKYMNSRNEKLFNKLFENQGIKISTAATPVTEAEPVSISEEDDRKDIQLAMYDALQGAHKFISLGATQEEIHALLKRIDAKALYLSDASGVEYQPMLSEGDIDEIGIPEKTAWQTVEEEGMHEDTAHVIKSPEEEEEALETAEDDTEEI